MPSLGDIFATPQRKAPSPSPAPASTVLAGFETKQAFCDQHREWFTQYRQPRAELAGLPWIGHCDACKAEAQLQAQAQAVLQGRSDAIQARIESMLAATEDDRQRRVLAKLQPIIEDERARLEAHEQCLDGQQFRSEVEAAVLAEILAELRGKQ